MLCFTLLSFITRFGQVCEGSGVVEIRLVSFKNPFGKRLDGKCCDTPWYHWWGEAEDDCGMCDHVFQLCVGNVTT